MITTGINLYLLQIGPDFPPNLATLAPAVLQLGLPDWEGNLAQSGNPAISGGCALGARARRSRSLGKFQRKLGKKKTLKQRSVSGGGDKRDE